MYVRLLARILGSLLTIIAALSDDLSDQNGEDFIPLKPGLALAQNFEILPAEAWELVLSWYGLKEGTPVIRRYVHNTAVDEFSENLQYEIYPPIFTIRKVRKSATTTPTSQDVSRRSPKLVASRSQGYVDFLKTAKKAAGIELATKVRVWRVLTKIPTIETTPAQPSGMLTPESSPRNGSPAGSPSRIQSLPLAMDISAFTDLAIGTERELVTGKDETANEKYNGSMNLSLAGLAEDQVLVLEEQDETGSFISETSDKITSKNGPTGSNTKVGLKANKGVQSTTTSGRNSPALGPMTRGRTRTGRTRGTTGLTNLGNTCYMNSALQCIRSVEELSMYFLGMSPCVRLGVAYTNSVTEGNYKNELNTDNPLGHNGNIAKTYAGLLSNIYSEDSVSSFSPKNFKNALGRAQPMFSGYGQQDSQEFLSFLVDALHEDLNRVKKKPYTENPESDDKTVHDPEAIKALGEKFRAIHKSRNDSVAMDLFNGFYKNTMICPDCNKVSVTFDPYSLLTLQLPIEQTWQHTVKFVPLRGKMCELEVDIDKNRTIAQLKEYIGKRFGDVKANRLMGAEVYSHKFYRVLDNDKSIAECNIGQRDDVWFFELSDVPSNWPAPKKKQQYRSMLYPHASSEEDIPKSASPLGDRLIVPIFHRAPNNSTYRAQQWGLVLWPSYIVLDREEAKDYDSILRKVLGKVAQMTTRPILTEFSGTSLDQSRTGSDVVLTTEEDASANGDPRVHDGSVEGEDNMVEVTMTEPVADTPGELAEEEGTPDILKPGSFIPPEFRKLFDMKHTRPGKEMVPTGWSSVDHSKVYEPISKRIRIPPSRESSEHSFGEASNASSSEETDDIPQFSADAQSSIEMIDQSSDEDIPSVERPTVVRGGRGKKMSKKERREAKRLHNKRNAKNYSKKGKDRFAEQNSNSFSDPESDDDEGLVRLGEALVLEWAADAYDALFDGTSPNDARGMDTLKGIEHVVDEELRAKKALRAQRKKNGITLDECFAETSKSEILSEDNAWYCSRCKELRRATKTLEIWTVPDILVVHLKRFSAIRTVRDKVDALIDFPIEGLDLSGKVGLQDGKELLYDLFAVDNHYGGLGGGHYTAYAQNFFDKQWYEYNGMAFPPRYPSPTHL
jgi:ubiquitin carboxyl-terminal hydrolase 4/11/15